MTSRVFEILTFYISTKYLQGKIDYILVTFQISTRFLAKRDGYRRLKRQS